mgnify:CR=1 FL=1
MSEIKCPYCNTAITTKDEICPKCGKELNIQCPYCRQQIRAYNEICPYCTSKLIKKDYSNIFIILGTLISIIWIISNMIILAAFSYWPKIFTIKDHHDTEAFMVADYMRLCGSTMLVQIVLYVIALVIQSKTKKAATAGIIINVVMLFIFVFYALYIKFALA